MLALLRKQDGKMRGFTLIELLVVIAIIGILAAIVLVSLNTARVRGRDARRVGDFASLAAALELYADTVGDYPIATDSGTIYSNFTDMVAALQATGLLSTSPQDPQNTPAPGTQRYAYLGPGATGAGCVPLTLGYIMKVSLERDATSAARDNGCLAYVGEAALTINCDGVGDDNEEYCLYQSSG